MLASITWKQFMEWRYYAEVEPFDETRMDRRFADIQHLLVNRWRDSKKYPNPIPIEQVMTVFGDTPRPAQPKMSWQHMKQLGQMTAAMYNRIHEEQNRLQLVRAA